MDNTGQITEDAKNDLYKKIIDIMLVSLENGALSADDSEEISVFTIDSLEDANDEYYLEAFIEELASRWPVFSPLLAPIHEEQASTNDQQAIQNVTNEIKNLTQ